MSDKKKFKIEPNIKFKNYWKLGKGSGRAENPFGKNFNLAYKKVF
jgi:hypothetical protein